MIKKCINCGNDYTTKIINKKYCSRKCIHGFIYGNGSPFKHISTGTVGALGELLVSADLMKKGYEVYRALSPSSSCDVLILKNNKMNTVEIRTGYRSTDGKKITTNRVNIKANILATIIHSTNEIIYEPKTF